MHAAVSSCKSGVEIRGRVMELDDLLDCVPWEIKRRERARRWDLRLCGEERDR